MNSPNHHAVIRKLCPDIVPHPKSKEISNLEYVLANKSVIKQVGHEWHARVQNFRFVFEKKPCSEYLSELVNSPVDFTRHIAAVDDLRKKIVNSSRFCNPHRTIKVNDSDPPCKGCGGTKYLDCRTHYTCANGRCAVVRRKIEQGLDYRNIKERSNSVGDPNSSNWHTLNSLVSDASDRQTIISTCPAKDGEKGMSSRNLNSWQKRMWRNDKMPTHVTATDDQIIRALGVIEDICEDLYLGKIVVQKSHELFCRFVRSRKDLPREQEIIAACLFQALPRNVKVYPKKRKRYLTPYNDTKKKPLKFMSFKKNGVRARASTL